MAQAQQQIMKRMMTVQTMRIKTGNRMIRVRDPVKDKLKFYLLLETFHVQKCNFR